MFLWDWFSGVLSFLGKIIQNYCIIFWERLEDTLASKLRRPAVFTVNPSHYDI